MKVYIIFILLCWGSCVWAATSIGEVLKIRGEVLRTHAGKTEGQNLKEKDQLFEGDILKTEKSSFVRVKLLDDTLLNIGPESSFAFEKIGVESDKRDNLYNLTVGQLRAHVQKKAKEGEKIIFKSGTIPLGVRGTEFLTSVLKGEKLSTDALVLSGKIDAAGTALTPGQLFNSEKGIWKTLSADELSAIKENAESFIPESLLKGGVNLLPAVGGALVGAAASALTSDAPGSGIPGAAQTATVTIIEKHIVEVVKVKDVELPWDIKDAIKNRDKMKAQNRCYFWEYKVLPGSYVPQRFRRERDCDDYQEGR